MNLIDQIKRDREAGTPGPWEIDGLTLYSSRACVWNGLASWENAWQAQFMQDGKHQTPIEEVQANARRSARVPDMEAALIAADELAACMTIATSGRDATPDEYARGVAALAAYRTATEAKP